MPPYFLSNIGSAHRLPRGNSTAFNGLATCDNPHDFDGLLELSYGTPAEPSENLAVTFLKVPLSESPGPVNFRLTVPVAAVRPGPAFDLCPDAGRSAGVRGGAL